jgi:hypothetical protein
LVLPGSAYWTRDDLSEEAQQIRHRLFVDASIIVAIIKYRLDEGCRHPPTHQRSILV